MGFRSFIKKVGKGLKKVAKVALPIAGAAASFIPGVGPAMGGMLSKVGSAVGGLFGGSGGSSAKAFTPDPGAADMSEYSGQQSPVNVTAQRSGVDWAGAIGQAAPAFLGYLGQKQTNAANAQQAQKQMDFQEEQTSTSYQRGVADMKAAGLNPMLAYSQGGAASGGGAQATMGNELGAGVNSALNVQQVKQQIAQSEAQIDNIQADTQNKAVQSENIQADTLQKYALTTNEKDRNRQIIQDIISRELDNQYLTATMGSRTSSAKSAADYADAHAKGEKYSLSEKGKVSKFFDKYGTDYVNAQRALELANSGASAVDKLNPFKFNFKFGK
ncbi:MAG: DNA pilot protein [Arizlama microvirus]|nr:MAG: DNA pilot protein [Arizlama microvirus]